MTNDFTLTQNDAESTALAFADVEGCGRWLRGLPLSNIPKHYEAIRDQLERVLVERNLHVDALFQERPQRAEITVQKPHEGRHVERLFSG